MTKESPDDVLFFLELSPFFFSTTCFYTANSFQTLHKWWAFFFSFGFLYYCHYGYRNCHKPPHSFLLLLNQRKRGLTNEKCPRFPCYTTSQRSNSYSGY